VTRRAALAGGALAFSAALLLAGLPARAADAVAPDDPGLVNKMGQLCLRAALADGGIDKDTAGFCHCAAPIFARHMKPDSRRRLAIDNRLDVRPDYDDPKATSDEIVRGCKVGAP
jgi:hypothetical protein